MKKHTCDIAYCVEYGTAGGCSIRWFKSARPAKAFRNSLAAYGSRLIKIRLEVENG